MPRPSSDSPRAFAGLAAALPLLALYTATGALSPGFDDEIYTIGLATGSDTPAALIATLATSDLHPPGSYLIVRLLHQVTDSFPAVRAIAGAVNAVMLYWLWRETAPRSRPAAAFAYLALCLSPTLLLWGATLRWYSWFLPLIIGILLLVHRNPAGRWHFWGGFAALGTGLVHVGYFGLVLMPALLAAAFWQRRARLRLDGWAIPASAAMALVASAPLLLLMLPGQIDLGLGVHDQSLLRKALGIGLHALMTHAAMPPSLPALAFAAGNLVLLGAALRAGRAAFATPSGIVFLGGLAVAFAAGLTGHFRSLVALSPAQGVWQGRLFQMLSARFWRAVAAGLFVVGTAVGLLNVVTHRDTAKGSWNTPYPAVLEAIAALRARCPQAPVVTHDPVLLWHLQERGAAWLWADARWPPGSLEPPDVPFDRVLAEIGEAPCLIVAETFRGSMAPEAYQRFRAALARRGGEREIRHFGTDRHAAFKRLFDPAAPDHLVSLIFFPRP